MPTSNVTSIVDYSPIYLQLTVEGQFVYVKNAYVETYIDPNDPNIVLFKWHWYEINEGERVYYLDFNRIIAPATASAAALKAAIDAMLISQLTSIDEEYWKHMMLGGM